MINTTSHRQAGLKQVAGITAVLALVFYGSPNGFAEETGATLGSAVEQVTEMVQNQGSQPAEEAGRQQWRKERLQKFLESHPKLKERIDSNGDGQINREELKQARKIRKLRQHFRQRGDDDNNPPGVAGGQGTHWENAPGPQGGPGASPDRQYRPYRKDRDNNPPGLAGGRGTHWENRPGPQGGPGASPNRPVEKNRAR